MSPSLHPGSDRGERVYDIYSRLLRERIVFVMGPVSLPVEPVSKSGASWRVRQRPAALFNR